MQQISANANGNCIIVIPFFPASFNNPLMPLEIDRLYFWHDKTFNHPITDETLKYFLFHAKLFGATVYPNCPELGCIAINVPALLQDGETDVNQILYKGQIIYLRSN